MPGPLLGSVPAGEGAAAERGSPAASSPADGTRAGAGQALRRLGTGFSILRVKP